MAYLNKIMLMGNVGSINVRKSNDMTYASLSLATTKRYTTKSGEQKEQTTWHNLNLSGRLAEVVERYVKKGDPLYAEGEYVQRHYTASDGSERTVFEVNVSSIQMLGSRDSSNYGNSQADDIPW